MQFVTLERYYTTHGTRTEQRVTGVDTWEMRCRSTPFERKDR